MVRLRDTPETWRDIANSRYGYVGIEINVNEFGDKMPSRRMLYKTYATEEEDEMFYLGIPLGGFGNGKSVSMCKLKGFLKPEDTIKSFVGNFHNQFKIYASDDPADMVKWIMGDNIVIKYKR